MKQQGHTSRVSRLIYVAFKDHLKLFMVLELSATIPINFLTTKAEEAKENIFKTL